MATATTRSSRGRATPPATWRTSRPRGPVTSLDTEKPSSSASAPAAAAGASLVVDYTAGDNIGVTTVELWVKAPGESAYTLYDSTTSGAASGTFSVTTVAEGSYSFYTLAYDAAGNAEDVPSDADAVTVIDRTPPTVGLTGARGDEVEPDRPRLHGRRHGLGSRRSPALGQAARGLRLLARPHRQLAGHHRLVQLHARGGRRQLRLLPDRNRRGGQRAGAPGGCRRDRRVRHGRSDRGRREWSVRELVVPGLVHRRRHGLRARQGRAVGQGAGRLGVLARRHRQLAGKQRYVHVRAAGG